MKKIGYFILGFVLTIGGSALAISYQAIDLTSGNSGIVGPLSVAKGGSGAATLTGIVRGNGTSAFDTVTGLSVTKTVRAAGGGSDCSLIFTNGVLTGGSC